MTKQVIFRLDNDEYGIDINLVNAIEKYTAIISIPNAPKCIEGIINLRGEVIPVYSLREKFNLPKKTPDANTKLIITVSKGIQMAFEVDEMKEIVEIKSKNISDAPIIIQSEATEYLDKVARVKDRLVLLLNIDGIIDISEQKRIQKMLDKHQGSEESSGK